jgi:hypothetical protein
MDWYDVLGVKPGATPRQIIKAYRRRVRQCHPDINDDPKAVEQFYQVQLAFEVLSDAMRRRRFDESRGYRAAPVAVRAARPRGPLPPEVVMAARGRGPQRRNWYAWIERTLVAVDVPLLLVAVWLTVEVVREQMMEAQRQDRGAEVDMSEWMERIPPMKPWPEEGSYFSSDGGVEGGGDSGPGLRR